MAMTSGNSPHGVASEINVTPLIDVLLVLLIVFMVIVPMVPKGQEAVLPQSAKDDGVKCDTVVVSLAQSAEGPLRYEINRIAVSKSDLEARLMAIYANRAERVMFIKGDDDIDFSQVAEAIDMGHAAGVDHVGLLTPKVLEGD